VECVEREEKKERRERGVGGGEREQRREGRNGHLIRPYSDVRIINSLICIIILLNLFLLQFIFI
jgi:hypothetical protein